MDTISPGTPTLIFLKGPFDRLTVKWSKKWSFPTVSPENIFVEVPKTRNAVRVWYAQTALPWVFEWQSTDLLDDVDWQLAFGILGEDDEYGVKSERLMGHAGSMEDYEFFRPFYTRLDISPKEAKVPIKDL